MTAIRSTEKVLVVTHAAANGQYLTVGDLDKFTDEAALEGVDPQTPLYVRANEAGNAAVLEIRVVTAATTEQVSTHEAVMVKALVSEDAEDAAVVDDWTARGRPRGRFFTDDGEPDGPPTVDLPSASPESGDGA